MDEDRIVNPQGREEDAAADKSLRPRQLSAYIGQEKVVDNLKIAIAAAKGRDEPLDHILFYGPPGLGKTTLAGCTANEMGVSLRITSGPAIERAGDLAAILTNLKKNDLLFIDEVHRLNRAIEEVLYPAMEDFALDIIVGKGPSARNLRLKLPKFSVIGATTREALAQLEVDELGLDENDRRLLRAIIELFGGGPVGLSTLAAALAEEVDAIEDVYEPFLIQLGFLQRTPRGRVATRRAYEHLGIPYTERRSSTADEGVQGTL